ncbi:DUF427 domain-containing protein [uncultured Devosia sp.]|uniref:DUF427 domain-containing protein n=1 Tax=uncultured Devosia sp. TaxID=211434 RepID=UPI0035CBEBA8
MPPVMPTVPKPGQESVWDYPRPPRLEPFLKRVQIVFAGAQIVDAPQCWRVLETSHPPVYYIDQAFIAAGALVPAPGGSLCEWKGAARYFDVLSNGEIAHRAAWSYPAPLPPYAALANAVAFYAGSMERCLVGGEAVTPQPGGFYGGWITANVVGPFKGDPGSMGW